MRDGCQGAHELILDMVGWRDPNLISVAAFYGDPDLRINFCGKLATDPHPLVCQLTRLHCCVLFMQCVHVLG
jgi:hypothetical protein